jgi:hypothetical protein
MMRFDELLDQHDIETKRAGEHEHARGNWVQFDCPFCEIGDRRFHAGFNPDGNYINCWICGHHRLTDTLAALLDITYGDAKTLISRLDRPDAPTPIRRGKLKLPGHPLGLPASLPMPKAHRKYLKSRNFDPGHLMSLWHIYGLASPVWRIVIPIHYRGQVVSWTSRAVTDAEPKYLSASPDKESMPHRDLLYGEDYCRTSIIVTEGPTDVWRIGPGAVCTFGLSYSSAQVHKIAKYPVRAIWFDNEPKAFQRAYSLHDRLQIFGGETIVIEDSSSDPGSADTSDIHYLRKEILHE